MESQPVSRRIAGLALVLVAVGVVLGIRTASFVHCAETAAGRIESVGQISTNGQGFPVVIAWQDVYGMDRKLRTRTQRPQRSSYRPGETVEVIYHPLDPGNTARVNRVTRIWLWPGVCLLAGFLFFGFREPLAREAARQRGSRPR